MTIGKEIIATVDHPHWTTVYIAGDLQDIRRACREHTLKGLCVSIVLADFVFTGGMESGAAITLINYARFPKANFEIDAEAVSLAEFLIEKCFQQSASVLSPSKSVFLSRHKPEGGA